ncbi:hypothetical protein PVL29_024627 [Vitis rotundifolia]|uniref:Uncharacterized protein n=1 Tax=Vitis rotundifolia TaxID=103349 RepID=A0AA38YSC0_VITRO|nr:hypothetical protein PVL29_024627 [Vitis rotundifolia]
MDCRVCMAAGDFLVHPNGGVGQIGGFSHESEHDLAVMSWCSSDRDLGFSDLALLAKKISCIRFCLVKLLRLSGYAAVVWDHEYIDVVNYKDNGSIERLIIDIDFRSHFEIARVVESFDRILSSLPVIYMGSLTKLKHGHLKRLQHAHTWKVASPKNEHDAHDMAWRISLGRTPRLLLTFERIHGTLKKENNQSWFWQVKIRRCSVYVSVGREGKRFGKIIEGDRMWRWAT